MPELPEVEILVRHLAPLLKDKTIKEVIVRRIKVLQPTPESSFRQTLRGARFVNLSRRGKYLVFHLRRAGRKEKILLVGHLGMTGRMYFQSAGQSAPKHAAVVLNLGRQNLTYEDTRYFGRLPLDATALERLGPEPFAAGFSVDYFGQALRRSARSIKVKLLDQSLVAGLGNIYASEALHRAGISPRMAARRLSGHQVKSLWQAVKAVLAEAIAFGSTVPLNWAGAGEKDGLFYYGRAANALNDYTERLRVYDREGKPCSRCGRRIRRIVQAARSTFYCSHCQRA